MNRLYLSEIYIYPIKSLGGISVTAAQLEEKGLQYDRRWVLVDEQGVFITQRKHFELALLQVSIQNEIVTVTDKRNSDQEICFSVTEQFGESVDVSIWDDITNGMEVSLEVSDWFSNFLKMKVRLLVMPESTKRLVDSRYAGNQEIVSFADAYPCLIIGQFSLDNLNQKLSERVLMDRFRPNFVFTGGEPHIEDHFGSFYIGDNLFHAVKPCARCVLITVDQQTGIKGQEPLRTLASYRTMNKKVMFGQNLIHEGKGIIRLGDEIRIFIPILTEE